MLLIENIGRLQTPLGKRSCGGKKQAENLILKNASILIDEGRITKIVSDGKQIKAGPDCRVINAAGKLVTPGLIDAHTHAVFGGWREHEIPLKVRGATYLEILQAGGGILDTVHRTRQMSEDALYLRAYGFLDEMLSMGVTSVEIKSGYGLNLETELKQLRVIRRLKQNHVLNVVPTFMGAHALPPEYSGRKDAYIDLICNQMLPEIANQRLAKFCDIFCEDSVFDCEQSRKVLEKAKELGFGLKIHADEIEDIGGAYLASSVGAISAEHLIASSPAGIAALAAGKVIACLLPQTSLYLNKTYAPARAMIEKGIPVAVATDFNPGSCPSLNIQLSINLAYLKYRMMPEEILTAVTLNAAAAIGMADTVGSIEEGKQADIVLWNCENFESLCYRMGSNQVSQVIKNGGIML